MNVLVALAWPNHIHHDAAHRFFTAVRERRERWATCPLTQSGFVRISSNARAVRDARRPHEAILLLRRIVALPGHVFWPDDVAITESSHVAVDRLMGHAQVTDAHLLALAIGKGGRLATFDRAIGGLVPAGQRAERVLRLIEP